MSLSALVGPGWTCKICTRDFAFAIAFMVAEVWIGRGPPPPVSQFGELELKAHILQVQIIPIKKPPTTLSPCVTYVLVQFCVHGTV